MFCKNCGQEIASESLFCKNCGQKANANEFAKKRNHFLEWLKLYKKPILIISGIVIVIFILAVVAEPEVGSDSPKQDLSSSFDQNKIASSVVNIFCPSINSNYEDSGGTGTIITDSGVIITNSHIIPQDEQNLYTERCMVALVNPTDGKAESVYMAEPVVLPEISDYYDLAFLRIYSAYYDEETGEYTGVYPRKFPVFDGCENNKPRLGQPIRIFGYPSLSGGYSLTITDGIISSFPEEGLIMTSAKVSYGNSGGLAVDENGCMIGIPSMVNTDDNESFGIIFSMDTINAFSSEAYDYIEAHK